MEVARNFFRSEPRLASFFDRLDLSSGAAAIDRHKASGIYGLTSEVMCNRKFTVHYAVREELRRHPRAQVVILGSGMSPLGFEAAHCGPHRVYEIDVSDFSAKSDLIRSLSKEGSAIHFVQSDIRKPLLDQLPSYSSVLPTVLVLEGITHYLAKESLQSILRQFVSPGRSTFAVIEFAPPLETLADWVRPKAEETYRIIEELYFATGMTKLFAEELKTLLDSLGGQLVHHFQMNEMEKLRTKKNDFFREPNSGWVEVITGRI